jgi:hypothetical protein
VSLLTRGLDPFLWYIPQSREIKASTDTTPLSSAWPLGALVAFSCHLGQDEDWLACWCAGPCVVAVADSTWLWSHPSLFLNLRLPTAPHRPWLHYYFV